MQNIQQLNLMGFVVKVKPVGLYSSSLFLGSNHTLLLFLFLSWHGDFNATEFLYNLVNFLDH